MRIYWELADLVIGGVGEWTEECEEGRVGVVGWGPGVRRGGGGD